MKLPASWFVALASSALNKKPLEVTLFSKALVAWRDDQGWPVIMERYCSHMGADLAAGEIQAGCLECPFHGWRFDNSGQCTVAPDIEYIPKTAFQPTYPVMERYGYIWVWYGSATPLYPLPEFAAAERERTSYMSLRFKFKANTTARRVAENAYDNYHFIQVHGVQSSSASFTLFNPSNHILVKDSMVEHSPTDTTRSVTELPADACMGGLIEANTKRFVGVLGLVAQMLGLNVEKISIRAESWPGGHIVTVSLNDEPKFTSLVAVTPVAEMETVQQVLLLVKKTGSWWRNLAYYALFGLQTKGSGMQDVPIWNRMKPDGGGAYTKNDRGVLEFRKFYEKWVEIAEQGQPIKRKQIVYNYERLKSNANNN